MQEEDVGTKGFYIPPIRPLPAKWKPDITAIRAVIQFVKATQRLQPQTITRSEE
jgi:hypothetical protein